MRCPKCQSLMEDGALPVSEGLHWLRRREGPRDLAEDLPGTHAVMRPNHLPGWRCKKCQLVLFQYGKLVETKPTSEQDALLER